jgi:hypothetical protein
MSLTVLAAQRQSALTRIDYYNRDFENRVEEASGDGHVRHKCFVSYHSDDVVQAANFIEAFDEVFIPRAIGVEEDDGSVIDSEDTDYIRDVIRREYLRDSTVTIVLVGSCTWARKFVDWEIYASLRDTSTATHNGLLGILLPTDPPPKAPARLSDNVPLLSGADAYGRYKAYPATAAVLRTWIQDAFDARTRRDSLIDNSRTLRQRNGACP